MIPEPRSELDARFSARTRRPPTRACNLVLDLRYCFVLADGLISELEIAP